MGANVAHQRKESLQSHSNHCIIQQDKLVSRDLRDADPLSTMLAQYEEFSNRKYSIMWIRVDGGNRIIIAAMRKK
jgi:hypothetical protein